MQSSSKSLLTMTDHMRHEVQNDTTLAIHSRGQCSRLKSSMPFKRNSTLQNIPFSKQPFKRNPKLKMKTSLEVLDIIRLPPEPTSVGHCH